MWQTGQQVEDHPEAAGFASAAARNEKDMALSTSAGGAVDVGSVSMDSAWSVAARRSASEGEGVRDLSSA